MQQTIDVSGLTPEAVKAVERIVDVLRENPPSSATGSTYWPGPPPGETAEQWIARFSAWTESHPKRDIVIDDDRGSIYDRSCE